MAPRREVDPLNVIPSDASLIVTSPSEIARNLEDWRRYEARIHIKV